MKSLYLFAFLFSFSVYAQTVYRTPSGEKYHLASCRSVKNTSTKTTVEKALQSGLAPCKICKPPVSGKLGISSAGKSTSGTKPNSTQCKGRTKAGTRCKHMTRIGNGYCHQHQP